MFILDLQKLKTICYIGSDRNYSPALQGDNDYSNMEEINGYPSFNNTLTMKSK